MERKLTATQPLAYVLAVFAIVVNAIEFTVSELAVLRSCQRLLANHDQIFR
ncbi:MAG: hypothetical protein JO189_09355 [Deltaproteobacteria bacterium]|nr:hypothetical protein [Deltaproteobacteria bacterium]